MDSDLGLGFGTCIWDLDLGLELETGLGLDNNEHMTHTLSSPSLSEHVAHGVT